MWFRLVTVSARKYRPFWVWVSINQNSAFGCRLVPTNFKTIPQKESPCKILVPKYGPKIWSQNMVPKYGPKKWSPPVLRLFHRACASASTVLRKKAHAHQSIHGKSSICFQSHRRDFWNWVWLHGMRLANLLLLSCSFCFKLKFKSVMFLFSRV